MIRDENDRKRRDSGDHEGEKMNHDKKDDWIAELERELQNIEREWPGSGRQH